MKCEIIQMRILMRIIKVVHPLNETMGWRWVNLRDLLLFLKAKVKGLGGKVGLETIIHPDEVLVLYRKINLLAKHKTLM